MSPSTIHRGESSLDKDQIGVLLCTCLSPISSSANAPDRNTGPILSTDTHYVSLMSKSSRPANMYKALNSAPDPVYFPTTLQTRHCNHSRVQMKRLGHREVICHGVFVQTGTLLHWDDQAQPWRKKAA